MQQPGWYLKRLQGMGKHRLLVILTEDVHTFTAAFEWVPLLFVNAVVTLACFAYLAWLSWSLLLILALFLLVGLIAFHLAERGPLSHLERVRQQKDVLYQHFRSLIEGSVLLLGWWLADERVTALTFVAAAVIVAGVVLIIRSRQVNRSSAAAPAVEEP